MGTPLPGVEVRLAEPSSDETDNQKTKLLVQGNSKSSQLLSGAKEPVSGELQVRGETVFKNYWNRPEVTKQSFTDDGWFKTGKYILNTSKKVNFFGRNHELFQEKKIFNLKLPEES